MLWKIFCYILCFSICFELSIAAAAHKHSHHGNKERAEDGGFSPRDHEHFDGDGNDRK
jgi:hypothetical protein